jgi:hypothetical protein
MPYISPHRDPHLSFPQPEDGAVKVWRYLDLARLISLLMSEKLLLTRVNLLKDEFEGSITRGVYDAWKAANPINAKQLAAFRPLLRGMVYVSCWHANNAESEAMWRLYCGDREGIALRTSYERLDRALPRDAFIGKVTYVDYAEGGGMVNDANSLTPLMHKRAAFEHEREIRVLVWARGQAIAAGAVDRGDRPVEMPEIIGLDWDINDAIEHVLVSPYAPEWYREVVTAVLQKFAPPLASRLVWSQIKGVPLY